MTVQFFFRPIARCKSSCCRKCFTISCFSLVSWSLAVIRNANFQHCARFKFHTTIFTITKTTATTLGESGAPTTMLMGKREWISCAPKKRLNPLQRAAAAHTTCECICQRVICIYMENILLFFYSLLCMSSRICVRHYSWFSVNRWAELWKGFWWKG